MLAKLMDESQANANLKALGGTRDQFETYWNQAVHMAQEKNVAVDQLGYTLKPTEGTADLQNLLEKNYPGATAKGINAAQVLADGMPYDSLRQFFGQITGSDVGNIGAANSNAPLWGASVKSTGG